MDAMLKVATTTLDNVELLYSGSFKPINWAGKAWDVTPAMLQEIIDNTYARIKAGISPEAVIDHDVENDGVLEVMKSLSFGHVVGLTLEDRAHGATVVATFDGVPEKFADLVRANLMGKRSVEVRTDENGMYLDAVAFFGAGKPAVAGLNSLADDLFRADNGDRIAARGRALPGQKSVVVMLQDGNEQDKEENEMTDTEIGELREENARLKAEAENAVKLREAQDNAAGEVAKLKSVNAQLEAKLKSADEERAALVLLREADEEAKVVSFVDAEVAAGHVVPASKDAVVAMLRALPAEHAETAKELISSKPQNALLREKVPAIDKPKSYDEVKARALAYLTENNMTDNADNLSHAVRTLGFIGEV